MIMKDLRYSESDMEYEEERDKEADGFPKVVQHLFLAFIAVAALLIILLIIG